MRRCKSATACASGATVPSTDAVQHAVGMSGTVIPISGTVIPISGTVIRISGTIIRISGTVIRISGTDIRISGTQTVSIGAPLWRAPASRLVAPTRNAARTVTCNEMCLRARGLPRSYHTPASSAPLSAIAHKCAGTPPPPPQCAGVCAHSAFGCEWPWSACAAQTALGAACDGQPCTQTNKQTNQQTNKQTNLPRPKGGTVLRRWGYSGRALSLLLASFKCSMATWHTSYVACCSSCTTIGAMCKRRCAPACASVLLVCETLACVLVVPGYGVLSSMGQSGAQPPLLRCGAYVWVGVPQNL